MDELLKFLTVYKDYGAAGLFLMLYLVTIYFFYKELKERAQAAVAMTEKVTIALEQASAAKAETMIVLKGMGLSLDLNTKQTAEFIAFVRGRDAGRHEG